MRDLGVENITLRARQARLCRPGHIVVTDEGNKVNRSIIYIKKIEVRGAHSLHKLPWTFSVDGWLSCLDFDGFTELLQGFDLLATYSKVSPFPRDRRASDHSPKQNIDSERYHIF